MTRSAGFEWLNWFVHPNFVRWKKQPLLHRSECSWRCLFAFLIMKIMNVWSSSAKNYHDCQYTSNGNHASLFCDTTSASPVRVFMEVFICLLSYKDNECVIIINEKIMTVNTLQMGTMHLYFVIQPHLHRSECSWRCLFVFLIMKIMNAWYDHHQGKNHDCQYTSNGNHASLFCDIPLD
jgi:hypothetical protein